MKHEVCWDHIEPCSNFTFKWTYLWIWWHKVLVNNNSDPVIRITLLTWAWNEEGQRHVYAAKGNGAPSLGSCGKHAQLDGRSQDSRLLYFDVFFVGCKILKNKIKK